MLDFLQLTFEKDPAKTFKRAYDDMLKFFGLTYKIISIY